VLSVYWVVCLLCESVDLLAETLFGDLDVVDAVRRFMFLRFIGRLLLQDVFGLEWLLDITRSFSLRRLLT